MTTDTRDTDRQLILELKNQSRDMEDLVRQHFPMVYSTCFRITHDRHDAEDAAQAVFLCLAVQLREKREIHSLAPWLRQVACRASIDLCRRRKRRSSHEAAAGQFEPAVSEDPSGRADLQEIRPLLLSCLNALPTRYRLPLILHYFGGLPNAELAKELGCTRTTLRVRMYRGHKMLREALSEHGVHLAGGALGFALAAAVQWQVSETFASATAGMGLRMAGHALAGAGSPDVIAAAFSAAGPRISHIKLALLLSAVAASCVAAATPLLAKLREIQQLPDVPSVRDLAPSLPTFTAPLPSFSDAGSTGTHLASAEPERGSPKALTLAASPRSAQSATLASATPLGPFPTTPASARPTALRSHPFPAPPSGFAQPAAPGYAYRPSAPVAVARPNFGPVDRAIAHRPRTGRGDARPNRIVPNDTQIVSIINIPASTTSVWQNQTYTNQAPSGSIGVESAHNRNWISAGTVASVQTFSVVHDEAVALTYLMYSRDGDALLSNGSVASVVLDSGQSTPVTTSHRIIENNGQVIAVGRRVAYDDSDVIRNTVDNTSVNGWFAACRGEISLPPIRLSPGHQWRNWGEDQSDTNIDLINSLRIGLTSTDETPLRISLLSGDHHAVPILPAGHHFVGVWTMSGSQPILGDIDLTVRYDDTLLAATGLDERNIKLWYFGDGQWQRATDAFWRDIELNQVHGELPAARFFAVSTPEPSSAAVVLLAGAAGLLRRRNRMS